MASIDLQRILPIAIPLVVVTLIVLRARKPQKINVRRLWLAPVMVSIFIGLGLWFTPHPAFGPVHYAVMLLAAGLGVGAGLARAHTLRLSRDASGEIMAQASPLALLALLVLFGARMAVRRSSGIDPASTTASGVWPATIIDASMFFALAMVASQRFILWRRIGALPL